MIYSSDIIETNCGDLISIIVNSNIIENKIMVIQEDFYEITKFTDVPDLPKQIFGTG